MESFEFLYILIGLLVFFRSLFRRVKKKQDTFVQEERDVVQETPNVASWEDLMRDLKRTTQPATQVCEEPQEINISPSTSVTTVPPVVPPQQKQKKTIDQPLVQDAPAKEEENEAWQFKNLDDVKRAFVYAEILNRKT